VLSEKPQKAISYHLTHLYYSSTISLLEESSLISWKKIDKDQRHDKVDSGYAGQICEEDYE
jgi:hypothetical protein